MRRKTALIIVITILSMFPLLSCTKALEPQDDEGFQETLMQGPQGIQGPVGPQLTFPQD